MFFVKIEDGTQLVKTEPEKSDENIERSFLSGTSAETADGFSIAILLPYKQEMIYTFHC